MQTAPWEAVWSGSTLFAFLSASFVQILGWLQQIFGVSEDFYGRSVTVNFQNIRTTKKFVVIILKFEYVALP